MLFSIRELNRLITIVDANRYYEARFPSVIAVARRMYQTKSALLDYSSTLGNFYVRTDELDFRNIFRKTRQVEQRLGSKESEVRNELETRIVKALVELENEFDEVNAAISETIESMSE